MLAQESTHFFMSDNFFNVTIIYLGTELTKKIYGVSKCGCWCEELYNYQVKCDYDRQLGYGMLLIKKVPSKNSWLKMYVQ